MSDPPLFNFSDMFSQASSQLNFLLLAQREMVIIYGFCLTFMVFGSSLKHRLMLRVIISCLLVYSVAVGIVSVVIYNKYIENTRKELKTEKADGEVISDELQMLKDWEVWVYFTYALLAISGLIIGFYIMYEIGMYHPKSISKSKSSIQRK